MGMSLIDEMCERIEAAPDAESFILQTWAAKLMDACTPRSPKSEWFGAGPGQWDAWWVETSIPSAPPREIHGAEVVDGCIGRLNSRDWLPLRVVTACLPVAREGHIPPGWGVVDG